MAHFNNNILKHIITYLFIVLISIIFASKLPIYMQWSVGFMVALSTVWRLQIILEHFNLYSIEDILFYDYPSDSSNDNISYDEYDYDNGYESDNTIVIPSYESYKDIKSRSLSPKSDPILTY